MNTEQLTSSIPPELMAWLTETFSNFSAIAVVVFIAFVLWGAFQGWRRSIFRQAIHVVVTVVIAVIAFTVTSNWCAEILSEFQGQNVEELVAELEATLAAEDIVLPDAVVSVLLESDMTTLSYAFAVFFNTLIAPLIVAVLFGVVAIVGKIVTSIVCFFVPKGKTLTFRLLGIAGGVIEGALIAGMILLPLVGWVNIAGDAVDVVRENSADDNATATEIVEFYDETVAPLENHVIFQAVGSLGGNDALTKLATVEVDGEDKDLRNEFNIVVKLGYDVAKLQNSDFKNLTDTDKDVISAIIDNCDDSIIIKRLTCGIVNGIANAIQDGTISITVEDPYNSILMEAAGILGNEKTNPDTFKANLTTFKNVYFILSDDGVLTLFETSEDGSQATASQDKFTEALTRKDTDGNTVLNKVINELDKNENTSTLIPLVGKLAVSTFYDSLDIPEGSEDAYEAVKEGIKDVLSLDTTNMTDEEAKESITGTLTQTLENIGITVGTEETEGDIEAEAVEVMADFVLEKQDEIKEKLESENIDPENISDADIINVLLSYYTDFLDSSETPAE